MQTTVGRGQGRRHNFKSGVQIVLRAKRAEKFWGLYPTYDILGVQQLQINTESLSDSVTQEYACYNIPYWSCIYRPINIPNDLQYSTNSRHKECCEHRKSNTILNTASRSAQARLWHLWYLNIATWCDWQTLSQPTTGHYINFANFSIKSL